MTLFDNVLEAIDMLSSADMMRLFNKYRDATNDCRYSRIYKMSEGGLQKAIEDTSALKMIKAASNSGKNFSTSDNFFAFVENEKLSSGGDVFIERLSDHDYMSAIVTWIIKYRVDCGIQEIKEVISKKYDAAAEIAAAISKLPEDDVVKLWNKHAANDWKIYRLDEEGMDRCFEGLSYYGVIQYFTDNYLDFSEDFVAVNHKTKEAYSFSGLLSSCCKMPVRFFDAEELAKKMIENNDDGGSDRIRELINRSKSAKLVKGEIYEDSAPISE